jgi:hypothetical protein
MHFFFSSTQRTQHTWFTIFNFYSMTGSIGSLLNVYLTKYKMVENMQSICHIINGYVPQKDMGITYWLFTPTCKPFVFIPGWCRSQLYNHTVLLWSQYLCQFRTVVQENWHHSANYSRNNAHTGNKSMVQHLYFTALHVKYRDIILSAQ